MRRLRVWTTYWSILKVQCRWTTQTAHTIAAPATNRADLPKKQKLSQIKTVQVPSKKAKVGKPSWCYGCGGQIVSRSKVADTTTVDVSRVSRHAKRTMNHARRGSGFTTLCFRCLTLKEAGAAFAKGELSSNAYRDKIRPFVKWLAPASTSSSTTNENVMEADVFVHEVSKAKAQKFAMILHIVDATDIEGTILRSLRTYVGRHPVVLVVTKCDLLPEKLDEIMGVNETEIENALKYEPRRHEKLQLRRELRSPVGPEDDRFFQHTTPKQRFLANYIKDRLHGKQLRCNALFFTSGKIGAGIDALSDYVIRHARGRHVYLIGAANVGKSTITNALSQRIIKFSWTRDNRDITRKERICGGTENMTVSALPGTTLMTRSVACFGSHKQKLFDTPGLFVAANYIWPLDQSWLALEPSPLVPQIVPVRLHRMIVEENPKELPVGSRFEAVLGLGSLPVRLELEVSSDEFAPVSVAWYTHWPHASGVQSQQIRTSRDEEMKLHQTFAPPVRNDRLGTYDTDVVVRGLGWWAVATPNPLTIRVFGPPNAIIQARKCMFHPWSAKKQCELTEPSRNRK